MNVLILLFVVIADQKLVAMRSMKGKLTSALPSHAVLGEAMTSLVSAALCVECVRVESPKKTVVVLALFLKDEVSA
jgi:hypothetical protein